MSGAGVFLIQTDNRLVEMTEQYYESEDLLQRLLEDYPNLIAGDQIDSENPRRWLLVTREASVPAEADGAGRWYLDHLFLDQDAIPTLIEVKRSTDTRIRREVLGQMLDYAANAVVYWPLEALQTAFHTRCERAGLDADRTLCDFIGGEAESASFWQKVKTNLQAGRIRLVFVADLIPTELRRVVEFLNEQMDPAEVLAVEIKHYVGGGMRTLIPRVIGRTEQASQRKSAGTRGQPWNEERFLGELVSSHGSAVADAARRILEWGKARGARVTYGSGQRQGSMFLEFDRGPTAYWPIGMWTYGSIEVQFQWLKARPAFESEAVREEYRRRLNEIDGVDIPAEAIGRRPGFALSLVTNAHAMSRFLDVLDWTLSVIDQHHSEEVSRHEASSGGC